MNIGHVNRTAMLAALLALCFVQAVPAEVALFGEAAAKWYLCDKDGSKHPNTIEILQMVQEDYGDLDRFRLLFEYDRALDLFDGAGAASAGALDLFNGGNAAAKAKIQVRIRRLRDGNWTTLGKLKGNVQLDGNEAAAYNDKVFNVGLEPGDVLQWKFKLKKFSSMGQGEAFMIRTGILPESSSGGDGGPIPPGRWSAQAGFGTFTFNVNSAHTSITKISYSFSSFSCGGVTISGGQSISTSSGWPINSNEFTIVNDLDPFGSAQDMTIQGMFNESWTEASGSWTADFYDERCTGNWSGSPG